MHKISGTTNHIRRHEAPTIALPEGSRFQVCRIEPHPAVASTPPRPFGDLSTAGIDELVEISRNAWPGTKSPLEKRARGVRFLLGHLESFKGNSWQDRWIASGLDSGDITAWDLCPASSIAAGLSPNLGLRAMVCLRAVRPSLRALRAHTLPAFWESFQTVQQDPLLDEAMERISKLPVTIAQKRAAWLDLATVTAVQDITIADLTPEALLYYSLQCRHLGVAPGRTKGLQDTFAGRLVWEVLYRMGHFPSGTPATLRGAILPGRLTPEELVCRYPVKNQAVRHLFIDYISRRGASTDYSTMENLSRTLVSLFWVRVQEINPEQDDLNLTPETYSAWRKSVRTLADGSPRKFLENLYLQVRSLYLDLHTWAAEEPERWGPWVARCPIPYSDTRGYSKQRRRHNERMADRIRQRQPLLPALVAEVETRYNQSAELLKVAESTSIGSSLEWLGRTYLRIPEVGGQDRRDSHPRVRLRDRDSGEGRIVDVEEENAFWDWAIVETLRHTGLRVEELCELTQLSIRQYERPNGEVVALLVIAPSKTDRERVIPISADLFHVLASIVRRHTAGGQSAPLTSRFDSYEKVWSPPMPFLFQRNRGGIQAVISATAVNASLRRRCLSLAERNPNFRDLRLTAHDFRRLFATDLVNSGLPIHIGAALLGHLQIETTRGYVAVFEEDVVRHYQQHLATRRTLRPPEEYREVTAQEWNEFEEHFDKRRVELGSCGRPYGTPCQHEHACVRCPMLSVNPKMLSRLEELEADLLVRRERAKQEQWLGEIDGIDLTLNFLQQKKEQARRSSRIDASVVNLGIPESRSEGPRRAQTPLHRPR